MNLGKPRPVHDLNTLKVDAGGRYDVILSPTRPDGYTGDWWQLDPTSNMLLVRLVSSEWGTEIEPTLSIERLDIPAVRPRPGAARLEASLRSIPLSAGFLAPLLVDRPRKLRAEGYINKLKDVDNNPSSLNGAQAAADKDGVLRIVVSAHDPGVPNWLDTAGYSTGVIQSRWMECSSKPVPTVRKVALAQVRQSLPAGTQTISAQERDKQVRDRRAVLQQRPLW